jgi:ABC-type Zn uptake system ZnuABC Zn-binding protein ZnuA
MFAAAAGRAQEAQEKSPDKAAATVKEIMQTMTEPSSEVIFTAASEPPTTPQQWEAVRKSTVVLAESGNLLMTGARARDNTTWMKMARALVDQAEETLKAAAGKEQRGSLESRR